MEQTIIKIGNSVGITLPSFIIKGLGLKRGQKVILEKTTDENCVLLRKVAPDKTKMKPSEKEFNKWLNSVLEEDKELLNELSVR